MAVAGRGTGAAGILALAAALVAGPGTPPAAAGRHAKAGVSLWEGERRVAGVGEQGLAGEAGEPGATLELLLRLDVADPVRGARVVVTFDSTEVGFAGWQKSSLLPEMMEIGPVVNQPEQRVVHNVAFPRAAVPTAEGGLVLGTLRFTLRGGGPAKLALPYAELLDDSLRMDALGAIPASATPVKAGAMAGPEAEAADRRRDLRWRDLGGGYFWSEARPNPFSNHTKLTFIVPDSVFVAIDVLNARGDIVRPLVSDVYLGRFATTWVGRDFGGETVRNGSYTIRLRAGDKEDSQTVELARPVSDGRP